MKKIPKSQSLGFVNTSQMIFQYYENVFDIVFIETIFSRNIFSFKVF